MADQVITELVFDISSFDTNSTKVIKGYEDLEQKAQQAAKNNPFRGQADDLLKFNSQLRNGTSLLGKMASAPKATKAEVNRLSAELVRLITNQDKATRSGNWKENQEAIKRTKAELDSLNKKYDETIAKQAKANQPVKSLGGGSGGNLLSSLAGKAVGLLGAFGIAGGATQIITDIVSVRAEYQRLGKQLEVSLGSSSAAAAAQKLITDFANKTPHEVAGVTSAFNRLVDIGIVPTEKQLFQLSDIAVSKGKTINDYVEAIADAQTGEFERLKEFSVKAKKSGDDIAFTFKGQTTTVKNTAEAIDDYLTSLGSVAGVAGQTEEAGKTLEGRFSTLKDTFKGIANDIGEVLQPALEKLLDVTSRAANGLSGYIKDLRAVAATKTGPAGGGVAAFLQSIFTPHQFNVDATEAQFVAFEKAEEERKRKAEARRKQGLAPGEELDPLEKVRREKAKQAADASAAQKAAAAKLKADKDAKEAATKRRQINLDLTREAEKQVEERKRLTDELAKLELEADKMRLEILDKNGTDYLILKRKLDLQEIQDERQKLIEIGKVATGTPYYNMKLQRVVVKPNENYTLPAATEALFDNRKATTEGRSAEEQFEKERLARTKTYRDAEAEYDKEQAKKRELLTRQLNKNELDLDDALYKETESLHRKAGETEIGFEQRKAEELLKIRLAYYEAALELAEKDPTLDPAAVAKFRKAIQDLKGEVKTLKAQDKDGPKTLFQLLGLQYLDKDGTDITDKVEKQVNAATSAVIDGANQILNQQISNDQAKVESYDQQIAAKQNEIDSELELQKLGLANNVQLKRQEQAALQAERQKALDQQRAAQAIQLELNAAIQASNLIVAVSEIIKTSAALPLIGQIAAGIQIAAMFALFYSTVSQLGSLPKYHDGDEVTVQTARSRSMSGERKPDEVDARLQVGEGVIRRKSYQSNKALLQQINSLERPARYEDIGVYFRDNPFEMDPAVKERDMQIINQYAEFKAQPDRELHERISKLESTLGGHMETLIGETRKANKGTSTQMPDGRVRHVDTSGNVTIVRHV